MTASPPPPPPPPPLPFRPRQVSIPPLSTRVYSVATSESGDGSDGSNSNTTADATAKPAQWVCQWAGAAGATDVTIEGSELSATYSAATMRLSSVGVGAAAARTAWNVSQRFFQYHSSKGSNAYQFSPERKLWPFGQPLESNDANRSAWLRLCTAATPFAHRATQSYVVKPVRRGRACMPQQRAPVLSHND